MGRRNKAVKEAEQLVAADPIGKHVLIKPRGNKPGGLAIVAEIHSSKVLDETVLFYDVDYVEGAAKEFSVSEMFVVHGSLFELQAIATAPNHPSQEEASDADKLYKAVKEAEEAFAAAEKGKTVFVKHRGKTKPGGIAKVEAIWPTKIAKDYMLLYDVDYPFGRKEKGVSEIFVVCGTVLELNALAADQRQATASSVPGRQATVESDLSKIRRVEKETVMRFIEAQKGKQIFVKRRGATKPGGLAVVEGIWPTMTNTGKYEILYSVKYVGNNGMKESGIPQSSVTTGAIFITALQALAKEGALT